MVLLISLILLKVKTIISSCRKSQTASAAIVCSLSLVSLRSGHDRVVPYYGLVSSCACLCISSSVIIFFIVFSAETHKTGETDKTELETSPRAIERQHSRMCACVSGGVYVLSMYLRACSNDARAKRKEK